MTGPSTDGVSGQAASFSRRSIGAAGPPGWPIAAPNLATTIASRPLISSKRCVCAVPDAVIPSVNSVRNAFIAFRTIISLDSHFGEWKDRTSEVKGKCVLVRGDCGGRRILKTKKEQKQN